MLAAPCIILLAVAAGSDFLAERDGVRIRVEVASNLYTWTVENLSAEPINSFAIQVHHTYDFQAPPGWRATGPVVNGEFRALTDDGHAAIQRGQNGRFSARFTSRGAVLGTGPAMIGLADGRSVIIPAVWQPVAETTRSVYLVPVTICALAALHTAGAVIIARRRRARAA